MAGVDFDREFPQPPAAPTGAARRFRVSYANPALHRIEIPLTHALVLEEGDAARTIDTITVRRITSGELIRVVEADDAPTDDADLIRYVIAAMAGETVEVLDALDPDDAGRVAAAAIPFFPALVREAASRIEAAIMAANEAEG